MIKRLLSTFTVTAAGLPLLVAALMPLSAAAATSTVVVTQSDLDNTSSNPAVVRADGLNKWFMYNDSNDTIDNTLGSFVLGPGTPPNGTGSVEFTLGSSPNDRKNIATYQFAGTPLASITEMSYVAYSHSGVAGPNEAPFFNFNVDFNGSNSWQKRLVYVPSANMGSVPQDSWNTYDVVNGGNALWTWSGYAGNGNKWPDGNTSQYRTWNDIKTAFPSASVLSTDSWLGIRVGEPGPSGYTGNVDAFTIGTSAGTTTYDFEKVHPTSGQILKPQADHHYTKTLHLKATYSDGQAPNNDGVQWAVRKGTCAANTGTVFGNVDGHHDGYNWDGSTFTATLDIRASDPGQYCFVFNPVDGPGQSDVRLTRTFYIDAYVPHSKDDCKHGGWKTYVKPAFRNQGQCVSYVEHHVPHGHQPSWHHSNHHHQGSFGFFGRWFNHGRH